MTRRSRRTDREKYAAARARQQRPHDEARDHADWARGGVIPNRITMVLNLRDLYGPEVDTACGAREPDVDRWESGDLYPTWEQLQALAELTGFPVRAFMIEGVPVKASDTSLRFHMNLPPDPDPVLAFTPAALLAAGVLSPTNVRVLRPAGQPS